MKIFIAIPTFETIYPDTFKSLWGLERAGHWVVFDFIRGYDCAAARNRIAQQSINEKADYVMMVDNDIIVPSDALVNFLDDPKDVCLGYYAYRNSKNIYTGNTCVCKLGEFNYTNQFTATELNTLKQQGQYKIKIHGGGMGCAFIKTDVFKKLKYPWYSWINYDNQQVLSEDLYFCEQCGKNNIPIYTDTRVGCGHIMRHAQWPI